MLSCRVDFCSAVSCGCDESSVNLEIDHGQIPHPDKMALLFVFFEINGEFTQRVGHR